MRRSPVAVSLLLWVLVLAAIGGTAVAAQTVASQPDGTPEEDVDLEDCAAESPDDFGAPAGGDAIGYVDGYWYDEPIVIVEEVDAGDDSTGNDSSTNDTGTNDSTAGTNASEDGGGTNQTDTSGGNETDAQDGGETTERHFETRAFDPDDGLDEREREAFVARTAARVEALRCGNFDSVPTVRVETRSEVRKRQANEIRGRTIAAERFDEARLEAALIVGTNEDVTEARIATISESSLGYYQASTNSIVLVSDDGETQIDEPVLAHELVHALQDQRFDLGRFGAARTDPGLAEAGLIEGDANLVEHRYQTRCEEGAWSTECLDATPPSGDSGYLALELFLFQPYNDGTAYVERVYRTAGWDGVDRRFERPPVSSEQTLFPGTPASFEPASVTIAPVNASNWSRVRPTGDPDYDTLGPGTIAAAMIAPTFQPETGEIYGPQYITNNIAKGELDPIRPYNYRVDAATGWTGDRLHVYENDDGEVGSVWKTSWENESQARTFHNRYLELLAIRGAVGSDEYVNTYRFADSEAYEGAVSVRQNGSSVLIAHAPTVEGLRALDDGASSDAPDGYSSSMDQVGRSKGDDGSGLPGPSVLGALAAVVAATLVAVLAKRRR